MRRDGRRHGNRHAGESRRARLGPQDVERLAHARGAAEDVAHVLRTENDEERLAVDAHVVGLAEVPNPRLDQIGPPRGRRHERWIVDVNQAKPEPVPLARGEVEVQAFVERLIGRVG